MNKNTFKTAYSKITLSDERKMSMKAKLMEQMNSAPETDVPAENSEAHQAKEIKFTPKKRSPLKTALAAGSAAAAVALLSVGAAFMLNKERPNVVNPPFDAQSTEAATTDAATAEAEIDDGYYTKRCANGTLHFQKFTESTAEHTQPETLVAEDESLDFLEKNYYYIYHYLLGMDKERSESIDKAIKENEETGFEAYDVEKMISSRPLGYELWLSEVYSSDSGVTTVYLSEDGTKQVNLSVSDSADEFLPITLPDGGYLMPTGEYRSSFVGSEYAEFGNYQFIDPETFSMAAGSGKIGGDEYFTALYAYENPMHGMKYFRLDAKNITREQFIACIDKASDANTLDHYGSYVNDGINEGPYYEEATEMTIGDDIKTEFTAQETEWGELQINVITNKFPHWFGGTQYNVSYSDKAGDNDNIPEEYRYTADDITEYCGIDVAGMIPAEFSDRYLYYSAKYDEIPAHPNMGKGWGVNGEMLPGDDPEQFEISRNYIKDLFYDENDEPQYDEATYSTDKIGYFDDKTRIGSLFSLEAYTGDGIYNIVEIDVFDDWQMGNAQMNGLFARLPAEKTYGFAGVEDRYLYAAGGYQNGTERYIAGFKTDDGKYVVLQTSNTGLRTFAEILAKLFTNSEAPEKLCEAEYPDIEYNIRTTGTMQIKPTGYFFPNQIRLYDYEPNTNAEYFTDADEALAAAVKLGGKGVEILAREWTLSPERSAVTRREDGEPVEIALYFANGDKQLLVGVGKEGFSSDELRIPLPDGRYIRLAGQGYESTLWIQEPLENADYIEIEDGVYAGIGGRMINETAYYTAETMTLPTTGCSYMLDSVGLSFDEMTDLLSVLVFQIEER